ncbi:MAG TPA: ABC transporter permease, partial [Chloroflexota bacterium]|nr:ABC transporter permease [Chloroflexota bacterium]
MGRRIGILTLAVLAGVLFGGLLIWLSGYDPVKAYTAIADGSFGSAYALSQMLAASIPLATIALGTAVAFRVRVWNIGGEGQFFMGAFAATGVELVGAPGHWPSWLLMPAMMAAAVAMGALWAAFPGWLRASFGANEIITTLMLNYVAILWVNYLVYGPWKDPEGHNFPFSPRFPDSATFPRIWEGQLHAGVFVPIVAAALFLFILARTQWGYELRVIGENPTAAHYAGINIRRNIILAMMVSGGMAGLAGMIQVSGVIHVLGGQISTNYGYTAIIVAWLGQLQPIAILVVSMLFGALVNGGFAVSQVGIPQALGFLLQGIILFFVLGLGDFLARYRLIVSRQQGVRVPATVQ